MESWLFLLAILAIALIGKNKSLVIGVAVVMVLKLIPQTQHLLKLLQSQGSIGRDGYFGRNHGTHRNR